MEALKNKDLFLDVGYSQLQKNSQNICGDAFMFRKLAEENRFIAVLSDGLGSGVKANILASMTATMALKFTAERREVVQSAEIIMDALPICQERKISYATFTIVDMSLSGETRVIEMGNPSFILFKKGERIIMPFIEDESKKWEGRTLKIYNFKVNVNDRLIFFSDGISQAGIGSAALPLGWGVQGCSDYLKKLINFNSKLSSNEIAQRIVSEALRKEPGYRAADDMTAAVIYLRQPKKLVLYTGPAFDKSKDKFIAEYLRDYAGMKVICGGTSADIVGRELKLKVDMDVSTFSYELPPISKMAGIDLVTEGIFTLSKTVQYLEKKERVDFSNPAGKLYKMLLDNDAIEFMVGTRINEAHQDPNLPIDLEFRRTIIRRLGKVLETDYYKEVNITFF